MKQRFYKTRHSPGGSEGIALVIVLGLLAVLVVLGVAFSISMRTERMATRSYVDVVKARQLAHAAFNRVLDVQIPAEMASNVYPVVDAFGSRLGGATDGVMLLGDHSEISGVIYVPASLRPAAFQAEGANGCNWIELRDPISDTFYGEYAYLVVNCSGLLDANQIAGNEDLPVPRNNGDSPAEIRFHPDLLREASNNGYKNLDNYRAELRRFESVAEMGYLMGIDGTSSSGDDLVPNIGSLPLNSSYSPNGPWVDHLAVFSRFPKGYADNFLRSQDTAYIGGEPALWGGGNLATLKSAISDLEQPGKVPNLDHFLYALYDYADGGYIPYPITGTDAEKFQRFSSKPVPMVNEVIVSNSLQLVLSGAQQELIHRVYVTIETWFPFPDDTTDDPSFSVVMDQPIVLNSVASVPAYPAFSAPAQLESGPIPATFNPSENNQYQLTTYTYSWRQNVNGPGQPTSLPPSPFIVSVKVVGDIRVNYGGEPVDMVIGEWGNQDFQLAGVKPALPLGGPVVGVQTRSKAINDPRINWNPNMFVTPGAPTPGNQNNIIQAPNPDEFGFMYCRRGPLKSIGELGYLLYDANKPWQTIRLVGEDPVVGAKLIDRFTVFTNKLRRGLVNVNTRQTNALAATIWTLPIEKYPGATGNSRLDSPTDALALSDYLITRIASEGAVTNLSDLAARFEANAVDGYLGTANDKFSRESLMRNSLGLWGTRHQLFTIFVAARTFSDAYVDARNEGTTPPGKAEDYVTGEQRAVSVIWRDPFLTTNAKGTTTHQSFVQFFHWFSGAFGE